MGKPDRHWAKRDDRKPYRLNPEEYLYVAEATARHYYKHRKQLPLDDLLQEAHIALLIGCQNYDPAKANGGVPQTYLIQCVRNHLRRWRARNHRVTRFAGTGATQFLFGNLAQKLRQGNLSRLGVLQAFQSAPMGARIARLSIEEAGRAIEWVLGKDESLEQPVHTRQNNYGRNTTLADTIPDEEAEVRFETFVDQEAWLAFCQELHKYFPEDRESAILHLRLLAEEPFTLEEIAELYEVSRERIRQIEARVLSRIRQLADARGLLQDPRT